MHGAHGIPNATEIKIKKRILGVDLFTILLYQLSIGISLIPIPYH